MKEQISLTKKIKSIQPVRLIVISFALVILTGGVLLMFPFSARSGDWTGFIDTCFTSASAVCVTGLAVFDTWTHWSVYGQIIILLLIQVGSLGVVTFATGFTVFLRRKLGFRDMLLASENAGGDSLDVTRLIKLILIFTFTCEGIGALILMMQWVPEYGFYGIWVSVFMAISAYCNAGFDLMGVKTPGDSVMHYAGNPLVLLTLAALLITGGLGFVVISDIYFKKLQPKMKQIQGKRQHINFHTKAVLLVTAALLTIGTVQILAFEWNNGSMSVLNWWQKIVCAFFQSATCRTAGFSSVDIASQHPITKITTTMLMFIGASPASTGGGIKTTTILVLLGTVASVMRGNDETVIFRRVIEKGTVYKALAIFFCALAIVMVASGVIIATSHSEFTAMQAVYEATSAFSTTGLSTGITGDLNAASRVTLTIVMYIGRVGPVSLALAIAMRRGRHSSSILPEGKVLVG